MSVSFKIKTTILAWIWHLQLTFTRKTRAMICLPCQKLHVVPVVGSPANNRFFHRSLSNWVLIWERDFKKKENGGKMSSVGKNIRELCLFYKCLCCMFT